jgi:hypothetical protein
MFKHKMMVAILLLLTSSLTAQDFDIAQFINKYSNSPNISTIKLSGFAIGITIQQSDQQGSKQFLDKIDHLNMVIGNKNHTIAKQDITKLVQSTVKQGYELLTSYKDKQQNIQIHIKSDDLNITDVLMIVEGEGRLFILNLQGNLSLKDLYDMQFQVEASKEQIVLPKFYRRQA